MLSPLGARQSFAPLPVYAPPAVHLLSLESDVLSLIALHVAGGPGEHDLTHWKHACMLGMTCKELTPIVLQCPSFENVKFTGELVGPDVSDDRDASKESKLLIDRFGAFEPKVRALFEYGHVDVVQDVKWRFQWLVPLVLKDVWKHFYKPPGWKEAAEIEIMQKVPHRKTFPLDRAPIAPCKLRSGGPVRFVVSKCSTSGDDGMFRDLTSLVPAGIHVTVTCSTGIETFARGDRAHYLSDIELELEGAFTSSVLDNEDVSVFAHHMGIDRHEPPDLRYRWLPDEARKIAGFSSKLEALEQMVNPKRLSAAKKAGLPKLKMLRKSTDFMLDTWDPSVRKRQKMETREKTKQSLHELGKSETTETEGPDHWLPARASPLPMEPAEEPMEEPMEEPAEEPMEEPAEEPMEEPAEEPAKEPMEEPAEEPAEQDSDCDFSFFDSLAENHAGAVRRNHLRRVIAERDEAIAELMKWQRRR